MGYSHSVIEEHGVHILSSCSETMKPNRLILYELRGPLQLAGVPQETCRDFSKIYQSRKHSLKVECLKTTVAEHRIPMKIAFKMLIQQNPKWSTIFLPFLHSSFPPHNFYSLSKRQNCNYKLKTRLYYHHQLHQSCKFH